MSDDARHQVLYRAVGEFITFWCHVEWALAYVFSGLTKADFNRSRIALSALQNFRARRELVDRLGRAYLPEEDLADWAKLTAQIKHLSEKRNHLAHRRAYHLERSTFRFFSEEDEHQPRTFGGYADYQIGNIRAWRKEAGELEESLIRWWQRVNRAQLLAQPPSNSRTSRGSRDIGRSSSR